MNHTTESLLALTKSPEGLEQLRIIAAKFDKWWQAGQVSSDELGHHYPWFRDGDPVEGVSDASFLPNYPTSLDAIFAAEERLGLHDLANTELRRQWEQYAALIVFSKNGLQFKSVDLAFLPPPLRLIPFILTAQWKEQNQ